jgi:hypothetical protein
MTALAGPRIAVLLSACAWLVAVATVGLCVDVPALTPADPLPASLEPARPAPPPPKAQPKPKLPEMAWYEEVPT